MVNKVNSGARRFMEPHKGLQWLNTNDTDGAYVKTILNVDDKSNSQVSP